MTAGWSQKRERRDSAGKARKPFLRVLCLLLAGTAALLFATTPAPAQPPSSDFQSSTYPAVDTIDHSRFRNQGQAEESNRQSPLRFHEWAMIIAGLTLVTMLLNSRHRKIMSDSGNNF